MSGLLKINFIVAGAVKSCTFLYAVTLAAALLFSVSCSDMYNDKREINGQWQWTRMHGTASVFMVVYTAAVDNSGNVYAAGINASSTSWIIIKYDAEGNFVWEKTFGDSGDEVIRGLVFDKENCAYAVGYTNSPTFLGVTAPGGGGSNDDIVIVKFNEDWTPAWVRLYGSISTDMGYGIALDKNSNVYVTGYTRGSFNGQAAATDMLPDPFIIKLDKNGTLIKTEIRDVLTSNAFYSIAVDSSGNVYAAGYTEGVVDSQVCTGGNDFLLMKFDSDLNWKATRVCGSTLTDQANSVVTDSAGNIYMGGYASADINGEPFAGATDAALVKYNSSMKLEWARLVGTGSGDYGYSLVADRCDNIYIGGYVSGSIDGQDYFGSIDAFVSRFSGDGNREWTRIAGGASGQDMSLGCGLAINPDGELYMAGPTNSSMVDDLALTGLQDMLLVKYR